MSVKSPPVSRRRALQIAGGAAATLASPGFLTQVNAQGADKVSFQTNWRAQAEHGGYYQAVAKGLYKKHGIDAEIRMGGPQQNTAQLLLAGRVDMIMSGSIEALNYLKEDVPFLCIGAIFQKDPQVLMSHPGMGNDSLEALKGKPILISSGARLSFWPFLRAKYGYTDEQARPYTFNMAPFLADKTLTQQGYVTSEPYAIEKEGGVKPVVHLLADAGFDNYSETINISRKMVDEKKDVVQRFVTATLEGWADYLKGGEASAAANALIQKDNPDMSDDKIAYAIKAMNERGVVRSGDALKLGIGAMTDERWQRFYDSLVAVKLLPAGLNVKKAYSLEFVNKGIGAVQ
jgi:NitT/TauT family transport system substrate-binding protein